MKKLVIVGSVNLTDEELDNAIFVIDNAIQAHRGPVGSGKAKGIDSVAENIAQIYGCEFVPFPPEKPSWYWYKKRNEAMAQWCDVLLRVATRRTRTYGSGWTADRAEELGKEVYRVYV